MKEKLDLGKGVELEIDTSSKACISYGVEPGDRIEVRSFGKATVLGVGENQKGEKNLWYQLDNKVYPSYWPFWKTKADMVKQRIIKLNP
ncbi:hypothetical protein HOD29_02650 [archaeon]|jgi:hypothetical protein|nr:hypothetical protein [archaeon]